MKYEVVRKGCEYKYWSSVMDMFVGSVGEAVFESYTWVVIRFDKGRTYAFPRKVLLEHGK